MLQESSKPQQRKNLTLCVVHQHPRVLLGMKKIGFGAGRWNGFGGKVEDGESIEDAAKREVTEESGIFPNDLSKAGIVEFDFQDRSRSLAVHIFRCTDFDGEPVESEEMRPEWFTMDTIPFKDMWPADVYWLPMFLKGKKFKGSFLYDSPSTPEKASTILEHSLEEVESLDFIL